MTPETRQKIKSILIDHQPYKQYPYSDPSCNATKWIGRNLVEPQEISKIETENLLDKDIQYFFNKLGQYIGFFHDLPQSSIIVLIILCFDFGVQGLLSLEDFLRALEYEQYPDAINELKKTKWAENSPDYAKSICDLLGKHK